MNIAGTTHTAQAGQHSPNTGLTGLNREVRVVQRATGIPGPEVFRVGEAPRPECAADGVLVRVLYASVDPGMRGWLSAERNYFHVADGEVMPAEGVGVVIESRDPRWQVGDQLFGRFGWQQYAAAGAAQLHWRIDPKIAPPPVWVGSLGFNGLTAWVGLRHLGRPRAGDTVLITTAAGAVGSVVARLARASGANVVGIAGGPAKVRRCLDDLGYAAAIDYKAPDLARSVVQACPNGVDVYFDNTGGAIADAVFAVLNKGARIVQCGTTSVASWNPPPSGPRRERDVLVKRLSWCGFVITDHADLFPRAFEELKDLYVRGALAADTQILDGLDAAPGALQYLYSGANHGRLCIRP